tara:strand:+ start:256 stop:1587 length:1332 start_codon:yes stop_codon:yes gene_type:complete
MSLLNIQKAANLAGFSKILGAPADQFILFDRDTDGRVGRRIFINMNLVEKFNGMSDQHNINYSFQKIKQLSALAGGIKSYSNVADASEHMQILGRAKVTYKIIQYTNNPEKQPGIYITDLDLADFSDGNAGIYKVERDHSKNRWAASKKPSLEITSHFAAINGLCESLRQAARQIIPPMISSAYQNVGHINSFDLFYNPPSLYSGKKKWTTPEQKAVTSEITAARLAHAINTSQKKGHLVKWVVHGDGIKVLEKALIKLDGRDLSNHTMLFMAPTEAVANILPITRRSNIKLHNDVMKIHDHDGLSKKAQLGTGSRLASELKQYGMDDRAELLKVQVQRNARTATKELVSAATFGASIGALILAPAIPALTVGAGVSAAFTAANAADTAQGFRNRLSTSLTEPSLNPHLNPHKSVDELNLAAKKSSGNLAMTFVDVIKAKLRG